jgi:hypothetical protein
MYATFRVLNDSSSVSVSPIQTVIVASADTGPSDTFVGVIRNTDATQTLNCSIQTSWDNVNWGNTEWYGLETIAPGEARPFSVNTGKARYIRIVGTASGAGLTANVSAELAYITGVPSGGPR